MHKVSIINNVLVVQANKLFINKDNLALLEDVDRTLSDKYQDIIMDLSQIEFIDSTGLNLLLKLLTKARHANGDFVIVNIPAAIQELLVITKLQSVFEIEASLEDGLAYFATV